ncbi:MAG TPA: hypothetical protein VGQ57_08590, partial [Polyangiaceae bacterium]|nr:hypothetical protein [Polyangiaceae bacterium]
MRHLKVGIVISSLSVLAVVACGGGQQSSEPPVAPTSPEPSAAPAPAEASAAPAAAAAPAAPKTVEAAIQAKSGSKLSGKATLSETSDGVKVVLALENL